MGKAMMIITIVLYSLWFISWILALAGAGATTSSCTDVLKIIYENRTGGRKLMSVLAEMTNRRGNLKGSAAEECGDIFGPYWWGVFFQLLCIILAVLPALGLGFARRFQHGLVAILSICTAYLMTSCINLKDSIKYYDINKPPEGVRGKKDVEDLVMGMQVLLAGYILLIVLNVLYIIFNTDSQGSLHWTFRSTTPMTTNTNNSLPTTQPSVSTPTYSVPPPKTAAGGPTTQPSGGYNSPQVHVATFDETNVIAPHTKFGQEQSYGAPQPYASYPPPAGNTGGYNAPPAAGRPNQSFA